MLIHCKCLQGFTGTLRGDFCNISRENPVIFTDCRGIAGKICKYYRVFPTDIAEIPPQSPCKSWNRTNRACPYTNSKTISPRCVHIALYTDCCVISQVLVKALSLKYKYLENSCFAKRQCNTFILLICTLRSDFDGGRKVVLQTRIFFGLEKRDSANSDFFLVGDPEKKVGLFYKPTFFKFAELLFCHPQNHFSGCRLKGWLDICKKFFKWTVCKACQNCDFLWKVITYRGFKINTPNYLCSNEINRHATLKYLYSVFKKQVKKKSKLEFQT